MVINVFTCHPKEQDSFLLFEPFDSWLRHTLSFFGKLHSQNKEQHSHPKKQDSVLLFEPHDNWLKHNTIMLLQN